MCLGESTTAGQYPSLLEDILNQRSTGKPFSVIDKGAPSIKTSIILAQLESNLKAYAPDMVVVMMGINDRGGHIPYESVSVSRAALFLRCLKTYNLIRLLGLHIMAKVGGWKAIMWHPKNERAYIEQAILYSKEGKFLQAEASFKKAIELNPKNDRTYFELGWLYRYQNQVFQFDALSGPQKQRRSLLAEDSFKKAIALNPQSERVYMELGALYASRHQLSQAEESFKKAVEVAPRSHTTHLTLGLFYMWHDKFPQAEASFRKAIELNPQDERSCVELGLLYKKEGRFPEAEELLRRAIELKPGNDRAYGALVALYEETARPVLAKEYAAKVNRIRTGYYTPATVDNYRQLKGILDARKIRLVCVQYPMRSVEPLRNIFPDNGKGIIFVDNEKLFKDAVRREGSGAYFKDMFAGDFGHCTNKGNRLLAENIADAILKKALADER
ncbi:MAG TPA: tetratricopeptide repeat protein [Patescibacteria group bacterium]|nr:tetratricopeptide repeat protein [Patescibacteria group bacterium]